MQHLHLLILLTKLIGSPDEHLRKFYGNNLIIVSIIKQRSLQKNTDNDVISRLELKGTRFEVYIHSSSSDIQEFWESSSNDRATFDVSDKGLKAFIPFVLFMCKFQRKKLSLDDLSDNLSLLCSV